MNKKKLLIILPLLAFSLGALLLTYFSGAPNHAEAFQYEQTGFGAQFRLPGPKQGLQGFLEKNQNPFHNKAHQIEAAQKVVSWLQSKTNANS